MADVVTLVGGGGASWEFELPLSAQHEEFVKSGALLPADDTSAALLAGSAVAPEADPEPEPEAAPAEDAEDPEPGKPAPRGKAKG